MNVGFLPGIDENTEGLVYRIGDVEISAWCNDCGDFVNTCRRDEFLRRMDRWWYSLGQDELSAIVDLNPANDNPADCEDFFEAYSSWWRSLGYEDKRKIYRYYGR